MKLFNKISMMALAALAFAACSQDDFTTDVNTTPEEGEKTWAYFTFSFKESMTRAGNGGETAIGNEAAVNTASVYIFNTSGALEAKETVTLTETGIGDNSKYHAPATAIEVISGPKTIIAILNDNKAREATSLTEFLALKEATSDDATTLYTVKNNAINDMLMTGKTTAVLAANVTQEQAQIDGNTNHIAVSVDREIGRAHV